MTASANLKPGQIVGGKFRVTRMLGFGGMGVVFAASDEKLMRPVAIKALLPELLGDEELSARFLREARAMARLTSPHAVSVYELGSLGDGSPYMAMELLTGRDLEEVLLERGRVTAAEAVDYILQAVEGIAEAHAFGIVHRDLKLANLFLARRSDGGLVVKVLDFGLAKTPTAQGDNALTATVAVMGSPQYMSPEQLHRSRNVDARTGRLGARRMPLPARDRRLAVRRADRRREHGADLP
jgi:serine/threonine-protein kinase